MRNKILGLLAVGLLAGPMTAGAVTFDIAFTQDGVGDAGPDWFGTFEAPAVGGAVTGFSVVIDGTTYDHVDWPAPHEGVDYLFPDHRLIGKVYPVPFEPGIFVTVIQLEYGFDNGLGAWALSPCGDADHFPCGGGPLLGTFSISRTAVPESGTLSLLGLGLLGLGVVRRRAA